jgi:hypothetical protein
MESKHNCNRNRDNNIRLTKKDQVGTPSTIDTAKSIK